MSNVINLTCPSCGGKLQITNDLDRFSCGYCGNEILVQRNGGALTFAPVVEGLRSIKGGVDKTASELAIMRIRSEINTLQDRLPSMKRKADLVKALLGSIGLTIFGLILIALRQNLMGWIGCIVGAGLSVLAVTILVGYRNEAKKIAILIQKKKLELRKHMEIVK